MEKEGKKERGFQSDEVGHFDPPWLLHGPDAEKRALESFDRLREYKSPLGKNGGRKWTAKKS